jgi:hypothetical protein
LLLPALAKSKAQSQAVICLSNLKQLGLAERMYIDDGGAIDYTLANGWLDLWMRKLVAYQGNVNKVRFCAVTPAVDDATWQQQTATGWGTAAYPWKWDWSDGKTNINYYGSYTLNGWFYAMGTSPGPGYFGKDTSVQFPSRTPLFMDGIWADCWPLATDTPAYDLYDGVDDGGMGRITIVRHGGLSPGQAPRLTRSPPPRNSGIQIDYADSHAAYVPLANLWQQYWSYGYEAP